MRNTTSNYYWSMPQNGQIEKPGGWYHFRMGKSCELIELNSNQQTQQGQWLQKQYMPFAFKDHDVTEIR